MAVRVNLNAITHDGLIRVRGCYFECAPQYLDDIAIEGDGWVGQATVQQVNPVTDLVLLDVDWDSLTDDA